MKNEIKLVLELCKFINPDKEHIEYLLKNSDDYPFILGHLLFNRMGGVAYYTLSKCGLLGRIPREFRNTLKITYDSGKNASAIYRNAVQSVAEIMKELPVPYAFLKGAFLSHIYPDGLRTSNDIDILIEQKNVSYISNILKKNGFSQGYIRNGMLIPASRTEIISSMINRGETVPFIKEFDSQRKTFLEVDINFSLDYKPASNSNTISEFLYAVSDKNEVDLSLLSPVDFVIHLCLHLYKEATTMAWVEMGRDLSLYKFCDIYLLLHNWMNEEFSANIVSRIKKLNFERECYYAFYYTKKIFGISSSQIDKLLNAIKPTNVLFLKEVTDPKLNKKYRHKQSFIKWIFTHNRKEYLYETTDENA